MSGSTACLSVACVLPDSGGRAVRERRPSLADVLVRHTFANHFIGAGGSLRKLQKILGHASICTTAEIYTDPELPELREEHAMVSPLSQLRRGR
ncbi:MAG TPA: hypothetical protein ENI39_04625 [Anaerolineae bacterium]|nr:hypothetical protein [Anaerolineae bacterium]